MFDDQHDQVGLTYLQVFILYCNRMQTQIGPRLEHEEYDQHSKEDTRGCVINLEVKLGVQDVKLEKDQKSYTQVIYAPTMSGGASAMSYIPIICTGHIGAHWIWDSESDAERSGGQYTHRPCHIHRSHTLDTGSREDASHIHRLYIAPDTIGDRCTDHI